MLKKIYTKYIISKQCNCREVGHTLPGIPKICISHCFVEHSSNSEIKTIIQTSLQPHHKLSVAQNKAQTLSEIQQPDGPKLHEQEEHQQQKHPPQQKAAEEEMPEKRKPDRSTNHGVSAALMTTLLLVPLVLVVSIAVFIRWRKSRVYGGEAAH